MIHEEAKPYKVKINTTQKHVNIFLNKSLEKKRQGHIRQANTMTIHCTFLLEICGQKGSTRTLRTLNTAINITREKATNLLYHVRLIRFSSWPGSCPADPDHEDTIITANALSNVFADGEQTL